MCISKLSSRDLEKPVEPNGESSSSPVVEPAKDNFPSLLGRTSPRYSSSEREAEGASIVASEPVVEAKENVAPGESSHRHTTHTAEPFFSAPSVSITAKGESQHHYAPPAPSFPVELVALASFAARFRNLDRESFDAVEGEEMVAFVETKEKKKFE